MLASFPRIGKTTFVFWLLQACFRGVPFLGQESRAPKSLHYISEEHSQLIVERADRLGFQDNWPILWQTFEPGLNWGKIMQEVQSASSELVIIDSLSAFWQVDDENDAAKINQALRPLLVDARARNRAYILVHHTTKTDRPGGRSIRGGGALFASVDIPFELTKMHPWDTSSRRRLQAYSRYGETPDLLILDYHTELGWSVSEEGGADVERAIMRALGEVDGPTQQELSEQAGLSVSHVSRVLAELSGRGIVRRTGTGGKRSPFRYYLVGLGER